eukprot:2108633-Prymnesium_polylepis.2
MEAWRWLETGQVRKIIFTQRRKLDKMPSTIAESAQLALHSNVVGERDGFEGNLENEHREGEEDEEEEEASGRFAKTVAAACIL